MATPPHRAAAASPGTFLSDGTHTAQHCNTLQHTAPHCNAHCNIHCNTLSHAATHRCVVLLLLERTGVLCWCSSRGRAAPPLERTPARHVTQECCTAHVFMCCSVLRVLQNTCGVVCCVCFGAHVFMCHGMCVRVTYARLYVSWHAYAGQTYVYIYM